MSSVSGNQYNGNAGNFANQVNDNLSHNGKWEQVGVTIGGHLSAAEQNLIDAHSITQGDTQKINDLAKKLGVSSTNGGEVTLEGLQAIVKSRYESVQRSFAMFSQVLSNAHQTMMQMIQSIRAR